MMRVCITTTTENLKSVFLKVAKIISNAGLQLDVLEVGAKFDQLRRHLTRIVKDQNHSRRVSEHNRTFFAFVWSNLVEELSTALSVKTENSPNVNCEEECLEVFCVNVAP
jgi:hypothetical protein